MLASLNDAMRMRKKITERPERENNGDGVFDPYIANEDAHKTALSGIDWNFSHVETDSCTHNFHAYPARFIPQIPRELLRVFTRLGGTVLDPFVGGGTTCVEANCEGRNAIASDLSSLATLITKVKTTYLSDRELRMAEQTCENLRDRRAYETATNLSLSSDWFDEEVLASIGLIKSEIDLLAFEPVKEFCLVALSSILVRISKQDSDTRYVRVNKVMSYEDVFKIYINKIMKMIKTMKESRDQIALGDTAVEIADSRKKSLFADSSADFVVTSPPYPNAYDYHLYHRHRLMLLGSDPAYLRQNEIGAHAHYSKKNGKDENDFFEDMTNTMKSISPVLKTGRYAAIIIGDSIVKGRKINNAKIIQEAADQSDFTLYYSFLREIRQNRKSFNPAYARQKVEQILIFRSRR